MSRSRHASPLCPSSHPSLHYVLHVQSQAHTETWISDFNPQCHQDMLKVTRENPHNIDRNKKFNPTRVPSTGETTSNIPLTHLPRLRTMGHLALELPNGVRLLGTLLLAALQLLLTLLKSLLGWREGVAGSLYLLQVRLHLASHLRCGIRGNKCKVTHLAGTGFLS